MMRPRKQGARKTQQGKQVPVLLTSGGKFLDPVKALKELFERDPVPRDLWASTPLFRGADGAAFSTARIRGLVKWMVAADGGDPALYGAHSLRIGGATAALAAGVSALVIKANRQRPTGRDGQTPSVTRSSRGSRRASPGNM